MTDVRPDYFPTSQKSQKLRKAITDNIDRSYDVIAQNFPLWNELEASCRAYRSIDDDDRESLEKNNVQKIIVPIQFATMQTILTFLMEVFTTLPPVLKVGAADPYSLKKAKIMEIALTYDYRGNSGYFTLYQWFFNMLRYGYGVMRNEWGEKQVLRKVLIPGPMQAVRLDGVDLSAPGDYQLKTDYFTTFEGNEWEVIDNRNWFWDVRYPLSQFQKGNYVFERTLIHDDELYDLEQQGLVFNTTKIKSTGVNTTSRSAEGNFSNNRDRFGGRQNISDILTEAKKNKMHVREKGIMRIIPREHAVGEEERPIDYLVELIDREWIIRCEPAEFLPRFPYSVIESFPDVLAVMSQGIMELTQPLAQHLSFLFNSHMANVRKAVNDRFLADPSRIDLNDFLDPENSVVRLLPAAHGSNPAEALQQLSVVDITKGHLQDAQSVMEMWEIVTGASKHMFGQISSGRRTALELQGVFRQAGARMKMMADLMSSQGLSKLTEQMALLRQENMTMDQFMPIAGMSAMDLGVDPSEIVEGFLKVRSKSLNGVFNFPAELGALPTDRAAAAEVLREMFERVSQAPFLMQAFDLVEIFKEQIRQQNLTNLGDFINRAVRTDTMIMGPDQIGELYANNKIAPTKSMTSGTNPQTPLSMEGAFGGAGTPEEPSF